MSLNKFGQHGGGIFNALDKFGRSQQTPELLVGLKLTSDNNYDLSGRRLTQIGNPVNDLDAANKYYVDTQLEKLKNSISGRSNADDMFEQFEVKLDSLVALFTQEAAKQSHTNPALTALSKKVEEITKGRKKD